VANRDQDRRIARASRSAVFRARFPRNLSFSFSTTWMHRACTRLSISLTKRERERERKEKKKKKQHERRKIFIPRARYVWGHVVPHFAQSSSPPPSPSSLDTSRYIFASEIPRHARDRAPQLSDRSCETEEAVCASNIDFKRMRGSGNAWDLPRTRRLTFNGKNREIRRRERERAGRKTNVGRISRLSVCRWTGGGCPLVHWRRRGFLFVSHFTRVRGLLNLYLPRTDPSPAIL